MYTSFKSAKLTRIITYLFCILLTFLMVFAHPLLVRFFGSEQVQVIKTVLITFYLCCPAAWCALVSIIKLLNNILSQNVFTAGNVFYLRFLSWLCAFVSAVCLAAGFFYVPFFIFSLGSAFMALILRVLKSVMAIAMQVKNENDLTI